MFEFASEEFRLKVGLAEMLKGGVIMDVTNAEQAKIAEDAGACAVMALERVPADIRKEGGVARMANIGIIEEIMRTVHIPVMAKARIGHFMEARILEALGVDYIDESEVLTPADEEHHIAKSDFKVPFVCGARNLGEAAAAHRRGRGHDPHQGRGRLGQHRRGRAPYPHHREADEAAHGARKGRAGARGERARGAARAGGMGGAARKAAHAQLLGGRHRHAGRCGAGDAAWRRGGVRGIGNLQIVRPGGARQAIVHAAKNFDNPEKLLEASRLLGEAMPGLDIAKMPESELLQTRGW